MTIFIEGLAFPLGEINANGWGVPYAEADNAIKSLKTSVVRICSRTDPHGCDYTGDPNSEIGHVIDAWQDGANIICKAEITDSIAAQKIDDGTWKQTWSVFSGFNDIDSGGWAHGIAVESVTIVNNPAWESAQWKVVSAASGEKTGFRKISTFEIIASNEGDPITPDLEKRIGELETQLAEKDKLIAELQPKADTAGTLETQVAELKASKNTLEKELGEKKTLIASLEKTKAVSMTTDEAQKLVASELEKYKAELKAEQERTEAFKAFAAAREKLGLETNPEDFKSLSASDLEKLAEELGGIKISASVQMPRYPANSKTTTSVGRYDSVKKEWV